ncbi:MAG: hypothetical protein FWE88_02555 [Phycisphaerae bacterium]|nr:hypothetical protein [Phycisphaerae bacterium]
MSKKLHTVSFGGRIPKELSDDFNAVAGDLGNKAKVIAAALHGFIKLSENQRWKLYQEVHAHYYADPRDDA